MKQYYIILLVVPLSNPLMGVINEKTKLEIIKKAWSTEHKTSPAITSLTRQSKIDFGKICFRRLFNQYSERDSEYEKKQDPLYCCIANNYSLNRNAIIGFSILSLICSMLPIPPLFQIFFSCFSYSAIYDQFLEDLYEAYGEKMVIKLINDNELN